MQEDGQNKESPVLSRRAFRALFADADQFQLPPGRIACGSEREQVFTKMCLRHRGAGLYVKGVLFGSRQTKEVYGLFNCQDHPEEVVFEVRLPRLRNPQVHCLIDGEGVRVLGITETNGKEAELGALHNVVVCAAIAAARRLLPHHQGDLWLDFAVTVEGDENKIVLFGVRTCAAMR